MKLTDINIDCLEKILEYLEFGDLLSAASSNKRLNKAAHYILIRKKWHKSVLLISIRISRKRLIKFKYHWIEINDLKTSLQYIRCFGHLIYEVDFTMSAEQKLDQHIINNVQTI